jgi:hypothetical protein
VSARTDVSAGSGDERSESPGGSLNEVKRTSSALASDGGSLNEVKRTSSALASDGGSLNEVRQGSGRDRRESFGEVRAVSSERRNRLGRVWLWCGGGAVDRSRAIVVGETLDTSSPVLLARLLPFERVHPGGATGGVESTRPRTSHTRPHRPHPADGHGPPQPIRSLRSLIPRAASSRGLTVVRPRDSARRGASVSKHGGQTLPTSTIDSERTEGFLPGSSCTDPSHVPNVAPL